MEIKICGIRRREDIDIINEYMPEYIGFIFAPSKRYIAPESAAKLIKMLNGDTKTVGVFVNEKPDKVSEIAYKTGLDVIQLHGDEDAEYIAGLNTSCKIWKAVRIKDGDDIIGVRGADRLLLDKYSNNAAGGLGIPFNWASVGDTKTETPLVLAGGLNKYNVIEGIKRFNPVCVDVSSSVETDGCKDRVKIKEFIEVVRGIV